jgi:hypothetical protein
VGEAVHILSWTEWLEFGFEMHLESALMRTWWGSFERYNIWEEEMTVVMWDRNAHN